MPNRTRPLRLLALSPAVLLSQCAPQCAPAPASAVNTTVTRVIDGDTVQIKNGDTIRLIGIDAPEVGNCGSAEATNRLTALVLNRTVALRGGAQDDRDKYGRALRYVETAAYDAGFVLIQEGLAIARYDSRDGYGSHAKEADYVAADEVSPNVSCPAPAQSPAPAPTPAPAPSPAPPGCSPAYPGVCIPPPPPDIDCGQISYRRFKVVAPDPHNFDADHDGIGCES
jgi:endonuclease YncB( thermonuclease family)